MSDSQYPPLYSCDSCNTSFANTHAYYDHLYDEHSSLFATSTHDFVQQVLGGRRIARTDLQTPPAGDIHTIGRNLARFRDFRLALPPPAVTDQLTSSTVASYLDVLDKESWQSW